jgi:hypothetical protein
VSIVDFSTGVGEAEGGPARGDGIGRTEGVLGGREGDHVRRDGAPAGLRLFVPSSAGREASDTADQQNGTIGHGCPRGECEGSRAKMGGERRAIPRRRRFEYVTRNTSDDRRCALGSQLRGSGGKRAAAVTRWRERRPCAEPEPPWDSPLRPPLTRKAAHDHPHVLRGARHRGGGSRGTIAPQRELRAPSAAELPLGRIPLKL